VSDGLALPFAKIWACDFEFHAPIGARPEPICMVARELRSGRYVRLWQDELVRLTAAPFDVGPDALFIAYLASAELGCFLELGWALPARVLDLFAEYRAAYNVDEVTPAGGWSLLGALETYGLAGITAAMKTEMRGIAIRGGPFTAAEREALIEDCQTDVDALAVLLPKMLPSISAYGERGLRQAVLRGRYMKAVACMERVGVPIDMATLPALRQHWGDIRLDLIALVDRDFGVYEDGVFRFARLEQWAQARGITWPRTPHGRLASDKETFKEMVKAHPELAPLRELRVSLDELRLNNLAIGPDNRNRTLLSPFRSKTGRNQPKASQFVFGPAKWVRSLIQPVAGTVLAYIDWAQQEFAIAAYLSGDPVMIAAYETGDVYLGFAVQAGLAPPGATKDTHEAIRELCKSLLLGIGYGMEAEGLARRLDCPVAQARELLEIHHRLYERFWAWADGAVTTGQLRHRLVSPYGWPIFEARHTKWRTLQNFPIQAAGADMLRLACILGTEAGVRICAPVHDAVLVEAPEGPAGWEQIATMREAMRQASRLVLDSAGEVRADVKLIPHSSRYSDKRGARMWETVMGLLERRKIRHPSGLPGN
jgi:hypothetical protein